MTNDPCPDLASSEPPPSRDARILVGASVLLAVILALVLQAVPAFGATSSNPKASKPITFGIEPATARGADGRPEFSYGATAGAELSDFVAAVNYSAVPLELQVYATDAVETTGGNFGLLPAGVKSTGVGSWIHLPGPDVTLTVPARSRQAPGEAVVPFDVRIPDNATPGDHAGGIVASLRTVGTNSSGQRVILVQRVGTRVFIRVAGTLAPRLVVSHLSTGYHATLNPVGRGDVTLGYTVSNTGNVDLTVQQSVAVTGLFGTERRLAVPKLTLLLPGSSVRETGTVSGVWPEIRIHTTVTERPSAITGAGAETLPALTTDKVGDWAVPWSLLAVVVLVVLLVLAWRRLRHRRTDRRSAEKQLVAV